MGELGQQPKYPKKKSCTGVRYRLYSSLATQIGLCRRRRTVPLLNPFDFVLFGGTGDLAMRKLIPALYQRYADVQFDERARILACASTALSRTDYIQRAAGHC